jgi:hypothetical protein
MEIRGGRLKEVGEKEGISERAEEDGVQEGKKEGTGGMEEVEGRRERAENVERRMIRESEGER